MKKLLSLTLGLLALGALALSGGPAHAATTTAPGPYYATPSWDQTLPAATRFIVLSNFNIAAVLDRETGLVWEQAPDGTNTHTWVNAQFHCNNLALVGRKGWRLPTIAELASLVDTSQSNPALPSGHPFTNVQSSYYWSASTFAGIASEAWRARLSDGVVDADDASLTQFAWCVRGGQGG
jgi:hypothetical protein